MRFIRRHAILIANLLALVVGVGVPALYLFVIAPSTELFDAIRLFICALLLAFVIIAVGAGYNTYRVFTRRGKRDWTWIPSLIWGLAGVAALVVVLILFIDVL